MKKAIVLSILIWFSQMVFSQSIKNYDLVIYGGTSAGISAAIQASRMGKTVILIEPTNRI
ncbi:MAG TPA: FAD-dependent oxidoreductase [Draconibacterium sp.]|nr:FAD-dependent oxidoreductase [Draconibacterium sp.]